MLELLDRTLHEPAPMPTEEAGAHRLPPKAPPPIETNISKPWPRSARITLIALLAVAVLGLVGSIVNWNRADDTDTPTTQARLAQVTAERDDLRVERQELQGDVNRLTTDLETAQADVNRLTTDLETAQADAAGAAIAREQLAVAATQLATLRLEQVAVAGDLADAEARIDELTGQVVDLTTAGDQLATDLAAAKADRDALAKLFPVTVEPMLATADISGTWDADWTRAYNEGLADITLPTVTTMTITEDTNGWIHLTIPGVVTADLTRTDGALFTIVDTTTVVPAVNGTARTARLAITVYTAGTTVARDGTAAVTALGVSVAVSTPAVNGAPAGVALYGAELTPHS
jgi:outer membrane murein-binding lipoprotein Lpp